MENFFSYNQAIFALMLLGAKADGRLQDEEKKLLVELTSEEHHLSAEDYKYVISKAKEMSNDSFRDLVYQTLNTYTPQERTQALYWLLQVIKSDTSSNNTDDHNHNTDEMAALGDALKALGITEGELTQFAREKEG
ncbi:MAG: TerB family tellurite resistance protein [Bacteroidota bacterium]